MLCFSCELGTQSGIIPALCSSRALSVQSDVGASGNERSRLGQANCDIFPEVFYLSEGALLSSHGSCVGTVSEVSW